MIDFIARIGLFFRAILKTLIFVITFIPIFIISRLAPKQAVKDARETKITYSELKECNTIAKFVLKQCEHCLKAWNDLGAISDEACEKLIDPNSLV